MQDEKESGEYEELLTCVRSADAPVIFIKLFAETFDKDFWNLWDEIKDFVSRKKQKFYGNEGYFISPIPTHMLFGQNQDDMVLYWEDDEKITFSEELWNWFLELKTEFDGMMKEDSVVEKPLKYMVDLLEEAEENFYRIFVGADYFQECLDVIFVPEGPEHEKEGVHYWGEEQGRRLVCSWDIMPCDAKHNKGRMTIRRYLALVANLKLRQKVFGF